MATSIVIIIGHHHNDNAENTIKETFESLFNSDIYNWIGQSHTELRANMRDIKTNRDWLDKFSRCKFIAIFYLSSQEFEGLDDYIKDIRDIKRSFLNPLFKIRELNEKLKWLIVQSCRGNLNDFARLQNMSTSSCMQDNHLYLEDYIISYCTFDNYKHYRENERGTIFTRVLCAELKRNADKETLVSMLKNVNLSVEEYARKYGYDNFPRPAFEKNCEDFTFF